jgi:hypothetical protein
LIRRALGSANLAPANLAPATFAPHDLPIVFYGSEPVAGIQEVRWQTPTMLIDLPVSAAAFDGMVDAVARKRRVPPLSVIDRQSYRKAAVTLLDRLAQVR